MNKLSASTGLLAAAGTAAVVLSGLCIVAPGTCFGKGGARPGKTAKAAPIAWRASLPAAVQDATRSGRPILVDFYGTWCHPCKMMDALTYADPGVIQEVGRWVPVKVDVDKDPQTTARYHVSNMPTIAVLKPDGTLVTGSIGFMGPKEMTAFLRAARAKVFLRAARAKVR